MSNNTSSFVVSVHVHLEGVEVTGGYYELRLPVVSGCVEKFFVNCNGCEESHIG